VVNGRSPHGSMTAATASTSTAAQRLAHVTGSTRPRPPNRSLDPVQR
jgi:hypothetical protein